MSEVPQTAKEILNTLPQRFRVEQAEGIELTMHFQLEGDTGGEFTVFVHDSKCRVEEGLHGIPDCLLTAKASTYEDIELGRTNPQMAFMMGKIKVSSVGDMLKFINLFNRVKSE
jgi:putative sterol carrier protein